MVTRIALHIQTPQFYSFFLCSCGDVFDFGALDGRKVNKFSLLSRFFIQAFANQVLSPVLEVETESLFQAKFSIHASLTMHTKRHCLFYFYFIN